MNVVEALRAGADRTASRTGAALALAAFVAQLASTVALHSQPLEATALLREEFPALAPPANSPLSLPMSALGASALSFAATVAAVAVFVVGFRALSEEGIPAPGTVTRNVGWATLHGFVGYLVLLVLAGFGLLLFVLPGVFVIVSFAFFVGFVAVEDESVLSAYRESWALTSGRRLGVALFFGALFIVVLVATALAGIPVTLLFGVSETLGWVANVAVSAVTLVYTAAVLAVGFAQLRDGDDQDDEFSDIDEELLP